MKIRVHSDSNVAEAVKKPRSKVRQRGQSLVEFALVLPIFLVIVMATIDFGWALRGYISLTNAAREGARLGVVGCASTTQVDTIKTRVVSYASVSPDPVVTVDGDLSTADPEDCSAAHPKAGEQIKVGATYSYHYITPLGGLISLLSGGTLPDPLPISTSTTMRVE